MGWTLLILGLGALVKFVLGSKTESQAGGFTLPAAPLVEGAGSLVQGTAITLTPSRPLAELLTNPQPLAAIAPAAAAAATAAASQPKAPNALQGIAALLVVQKRLVMTGSSPDECAALLADIAPLLLREAQATDEA